MQIELEPHHEQQHGDADLRQQIDLVVRLHPAQHGRADQNTDHDEGDDQRLAQTHGDRADHRRGQQQGGEFVIDVAHD